MISPENRQKNDIISFMYVLFIGTIMPIKNIIKPISNNIIFSIYYINFVIYAKILKNIVITKLINNCYLFYQYLYYIIHQRTRKLTFLTFFFARNPTYFMWGKLTFY